MWLYGAVVVGRDLYHKLHVYLTLKLFLLFWLSIYKGGVQLCVLLGFENMDNLLYTNSISL